MDAKIMLEAYENFLFFSCPHFKLDPPAMRKDEYGSQIYEKIRWLQETAVKLQANLVCLGDLFDKKNGTTFRELNYLMQGIDHPMFCVLGNHDIQAYNQNLQTQPIGAMFESGKVIPIPDDHYIRSGNTVITASNYKANYEVPETYFKEIPEHAKDWCDYHIHLTHGMVVNKSVPFEAIQVEDIEPELNCDLLINGHNHEPWEYGKFINVGSTARIAKDSNYLNKQPMCVFVSPQKRKISWIEIPIETDVWIDKIKRDTLSSEELEEFAKELEGIDIADDDAILERLLQGRGEEVKKEVYTLLGK